MRVVFIVVGATQGEPPAKSDGWLTIGREYVVLGIYGREREIKFRILGDDGTTPALHSSDRFKVISSDIPSDWTFRIFPGNEWEIGPAAWSGAGFWNAYFDGEPSARTVFDAIAIALGARTPEFRP